MTALATLRPPHTRFPKSVREVPPVPVKSTGLYVLKSAKANRKVGAGSDTILKGPFKGMALYTLSLEERATCWPGCSNWGVCYGDHSPWVARHRPGPALDKGIVADVAALASRHPQGIAVRLHVLGEFHSLGYVSLWRDLLDMEPLLHLWGTTHWPHGTPIGDAVAALARDFGPRAAFRRSDGGTSDDPLPFATTVAHGAPPLPGSVVCPVQQGKSTACVTCGLCMNGRTSISWWRH